MWTNDTKIGMGTITFCNYDYDYNYIRFRFSISITITLPSLSITIIIGQLQLHYNYFQFLARHNTVNTQSNIDCIFSTEDVDGISIEDIFSSL